MKILMVVGARPNFMKAAPIIRAIQQHNERAAGISDGGHQAPGETIQYNLVHTGQHYDDAMSGAFFRDLGLPSPDVHLGVGSGSHAVQTAEIMKEFELALLAAKPDIVVVVGDVNSTLACALVTAKISLDSTGARPLIVHVEAGLRSFDRSMPEEINRLLTDQLSDLLFVTEESAIQNLRSEGIAPDKIHFVGNTMIDSLLAFKDKAEGSAILDRLKLRAQGGNSGGCSSIRPYALLTLHRPSNVDDVDRFLDIVNGLTELATTHPIIFPIHPRTRRRLEEIKRRLQAGINWTDFQSASATSGRPRAGIVLIEPLGYLDFLCLMRYATLVVTDSGGVQEESTCLGIPCVTVRNNTERPVTVHKGTNIVAGTGTEGIKDAVRRQAAKKPSPLRLPEMWDGHAANRIVATLMDVYLQKRMSENRASAEPAFA